MSLGASGRQPLEVHFFRAGCRMRRALEHVLDSGLLSRVRTLLGADAVP